METQIDRPPINSTSPLSTGAGLAIAGVWIASAAVSIIFMMVAFVWTTPVASDPDSASLGIFILIILIAAPLMAAYSFSKLILEAHK